MSVRTDGKRLARGVMLAAALSGLAPLAIAQTQAPGAAAPAAAPAPATEADVLSRLAQIRGLQLPANDAARQEQNRRRDNAWRYFGDNKPVALPVLRRELAAELLKPQPNQMLLLDAGHFLQRQGEPKDQPQAMQALLAIDADAPLVQASAEQLFRFVHAAAASRNERLFPMMDKAFIKGKVTVFVPQHGFTVDEASAAATIYGQYGVKGEAHLRTLLGDSSVTNKVLEVLIAIGSPDSVPAVAALLSSPDQETFARAATFLARAGGPQGREALLAVDVSKLEGKQREFLGPVLPQLKQSSFEKMRGARSETPVSDQEVRRRLQSLYERYGQHDDLQASDILYSTLPKQFLIDEMTRIRERTFLRVNDEALADLELTNSVLNTLRYRPD